MPEGSRFDRIVRCAQGHLFVTTWVPLVSFKAVPLGHKRFQHCPVGHHWRMVEPVDERALTHEERAEARRHHDLRLP